MQNKKFAKKNGMPIEEYGKSSMRKFLIRAVYASGTFLLGLLLSGAKAPLDTYPFIIALTSSLTSCAGFASLGVLCRLTVDGKIKYACVDGPEFDGHLIDFDEAQNRINAYKEAEKDHYCKIRS